MQNNWWSDNSFLPLIGVEEMAERFGESKNKEGNKLLHSQSTAQQKQPQETLSATKKKTVTKQQAAAAIKAAKPPRPPSKNSKAWRKPKDMPRRPLSAYNFFFQNERRTLLAETMAMRAEATADSNQPPARGLGFAELARAIAKSWRSTDAETKKPFEKQARIDKARYKRELKIWKKTFEDDESDEEETEPVASQAPMAKQVTHHGSNTVSAGYPSISATPHFHRQQQLYQGNMLQNHQHLIFNQARRQDQRSNPQDTRLVDLNAFSQLLQMQRSNQPSEIMNSQQQQDRSRLNSFVLSPPPTNQAPMFPTALEAYHTSMHSSTAAPFSEPAQDPHVSLESWMDLASDLMEFPCDECEASVGQDCPFHRQSADTSSAIAASIDNDILAMIQGSMKRDNDASNEN